MGADFKTGISNIYNADKLVVSSGKVTLLDTPKTGTLEVFTLLPDETSHGKEIKVGSIVNVDEYTITGKDISFNTTSQPDGTVVVCYYAPSTVVTGQSYKVLSLSNPSNYEIYGKTSTKDERGIGEDFKFFCPNATPMSEFKLTLDVDNIAKIEAKFELLEGIFPDTREKGLVDFMIIEG